MKINVSKEDKAGLYITLIIHLVVCIVLLTVVVRPQLSKKMEIEIDCTDADALEKLQKELQFKKSINETLKDLLGDAYKPDMRNVAVDKNEVLKDSKGIDAEKLYKEAARVQKEYEEIQKRDKGEVAVAQEEPKQEEEQEQQKKEDIYTGPAVVTYSLQGRKASYMPSPAFKCYGSGEVTVIIGVTPDGTVDYAKIQDIDTEDPCVKEYAIACAKKTRFNQKAGAAARQYGSITYNFIAQ